MSSNRTLVEAHTRAPPREAAEFLTDDFEWTEWADGVPPGGARTRGKAGFVQTFGDDELRNETKRVIEEGNTVVVEGMAHVREKDGRRFDVQYCDIFELENGKIRRKSSYGAMIKGPDRGAAAGTIDGVGARNDPGVGRLLGRRVEGSAGAIAVPFVRSVPR